MDKGFVEALKYAAKVLADEVRKVEEGIARDETGDEDDITSQILGRIQAKAESLSGPIAWDATQVLIPRGFRLKGRHLTSRGNGSEEKRLGADAVIVLDVDLPGYRVSKGVLIQAKRVDSQGGVARESERRRLLSQCKSLAWASASSYVWSYGQKISVFSANSVLAADGKLDELDNEPSIEEFFSQFFLCWVGDARISSVSKSALADFMSLTGIRSGLILASRLNDGFFWERISSDVSG